MEPWSQMLFICNGLPKAGCVLLLWFQTSFLSSFFQEHLSYVTGCRKYITHNIHHAWWLGIPPQPSHLKSSSLFLAVWIDIGDIILFLLWGEDGVNVCSVLCVLWALFYSSAFWTLPGHMMPYPPVRWVCLSDHALCFLKHVVSDLLLSLSLVSHVPFVHILN